jgi:hypothetical protein
MRAKRCGLAAEDCCLLAITYNWEWRGALEAEVKALVGDGLVCEFSGDVDGWWSLCLEGVREVCCEFAAELFDKEVMLLRYCFRDAV